MNEHTPGPWFWNPYRTSITQANPKLPRQPDKKAVAVLYEGKGIKVSEGDARLLAASPDLLVALKDARDFIIDDCGLGEDGMIRHDCDYRTDPEKGSCDLCEMWSGITAAISKATGKEDDQ